jgi:hypothetical protein
VIRLQGACDCHVHVFGPSQRYPFARERKYTPPQASVEELLALQDRLSLEKVVIVQASPYGTDNRCMLDALRRLIDEAVRRAAPLGWHVQLWTNAAMIARCRITSPRSPCRSSSTTSASRRALSRQGRSFHFLPVAMPGSSSPRRIASAATSTRWRARSLPSGPTAW